MYIKNFHMSDAQSARTRYSADRVNNTLSISARDYAFLYLPFDPKHTILKIFEGILNGERNISELGEILDIMNTILAPDGRGDFIRYYRENTSTGQDIGELYNKVRDNVLADLKEIKSMLDFPENPLASSFVWFVRSIDIIFSENIAAES